MTPLEALRALGTGAEAPSEAKQRVHCALLASLEGAAAGAAAAATATALLKPATPLPPAPPGVLAGTAGSKAVAIAVSIWLLGAATGAALYGALRPQRVQVVYLDRPAQPTPPVPVKQPEAVLASAPPAPAVSAKATTARAALAASGAASVIGFGSELARERTLLDLARASAARGEPAQVLQRVAQHAEQFPHGHLTEEREALAIRALLALGRVQEARDRARAFRSAYPNSFLTPVIDSALSAP